MPALTRYVRRHSESDAISHTTSRSTPQEVSANRPEPGTHAAMSGTGPGHARSRAGEPSRPGSLAASPRGQTRHRHETACKVTAVAGMVVPAAFYVIIIVLGQVTPGYDAVSRFASELSLGRYGPIMIAGFIAAGLAVLAMGVCLRSMVGTQRSGRIGSAMITVAGLAFLTAGAFLTDPNGQVRTVHGALHFAAAIMLFFVAIPAAGLALARRFRHHRGFAAFSALTAAATPILFIATVLSGHLLGVMERIVIGLVLTWLTAVAVRLHQGKLGGAEAP